MRIEQVSGTMRATRLLVRRAWLGADPSHGLDDVSADDGWHGAGLWDGTGEPSAVANVVDASGASGGTGAAGHRCGDDSSAALDLNALSISLPTLPIEFPAGHSEQIQISGSSDYHDIFLSLFGPSSNTVRAKALTVFELGPNSDAGTRPVGIDVCELA